MASEADRMIDDAEGRGGKAPPPSQREVGGYESLSQAERQQLARVVAGNMGGRGADVSRVLNAMNTNPNFAMQQLQRHGSAMGIGVNEANRMSPEREGMDYVDPASLQAEKAAVAQRAAPRQATPAPEPTGPRASVGAEADPGAAPGGTDPMMFAPLALLALRKQADAMRMGGASPQQVAQELSRMGVPPEAMSQVLDGEVMGPERGMVPRGPQQMIEGQVVDAQANRQGLPPPQGKLMPPMDDTGGAGLPPPPPQAPSGPKQSKPPAKKQSKEDAMIEEGTKADTVEGKAAAKAEPKSDAKKPRKPKQPKMKEEPEDPRFPGYKARLDEWDRIVGPMPERLRRVVR